MHRSSQASLKPSRPDCSRASSFPLHPHHQHRQLQAHRAVAHKLYPIVQDSSRGRDSVRGPSRPGRGMADKGVKMAVPEMLAGQVRAYHCVGFVDCLLQHWTCTELIIGHRCRRYITSRMAPIWPPQCSTRAERCAEGLHRHVTRKVVGRLLIKPVHTTFLSCPWAASDSLIGIDWPQVHPIASFPCIVPGYSLAFNIQGKDQPYTYSGPVFGTLMHHRAEDILHFAVTF